MRRFYFLPVCLVFLFSTAAEAGFRIHSSNGGDPVVIQSSEIVETFVMGKFERRGLFFRLTDSLVRPKEIFIPISVLKASSLDPMSIGRAALSVEVLLMLFTNDRFPVASVEVEGLNLILKRIK